MRKMLLIVLAVCTLLGPVAASVSAETFDPYSMRQDFPTGEGMAADLVFVRPLGIASCILGLAAAIVATPFIVTSCSGRQTYEKLVSEPFAFTFKRPLGEGF
jgi:hypothetical protein